MFASVIVVVVVSVIGAITADPSCQDLFPSEGGMYNEVCIFKTHGTFSATTFARGNKYYLMSVDSSDSNNVDLEYYDLVPQFPAPTFNSTKNCVVTQFWHVWQNNQWVSQGSKQGTEVNRVGDVIYELPAVVPVDGACIMTRMYGNQCVASAQFVLQAFTSRGMKLPLNPQNACFP